MPKVTESQIIGNRGENFAGYLLSELCLVRQVTSGTDVGIDLYCESITDEQPNNHFWVQVKSSYQEQSSYNLEKEKLQYWWRQPIPVFIFLIQIAKDNSAAVSINVINLTEHLIADSNIDGHSKTFSANSKIDSPESLKVFINHEVPRTIARQWLHQGIIVPAKPGIAIGYLKDYPSSGCRKFSSIILKNLGRTASLLLKDILVSEESPETIGARERLEKILECFHDYGNWDMHYYLGWSKLTRGELREASGSLSKALECIEGDKQVDQHHNFQAAKNEIKQLLVDLDEKISTSKGTHLAEQTNNKPPGDISQLAPTGPFQE